MGSLVCAFFCLFLGEGKKGSGASARLACGGVVEPRAGGAKTAEKGSPTGVITILGNRSRGDRKSSAPANAVGLIRGVYSAAGGRGHMGRRWERLARQRRATAHARVLGGLRDHLVVVLGA